METGCAPIAVCWGAVSKVPEHPERKEQAEEAIPGHWDKEDEASLSHSCSLWAPTAQPASELPQALPHLARVCLLRESFSDAPGQSQPLFSSGLPSLPFAHSSQGRNIILRGISWYTWLCFPLTLLFLRAGLWSDLLATGPQDLNKRLVPTRYSIAPWPDLRNERPQQPLTLGS